MANRDGLYGFHIVPARIGGWETYALVTFGPQGELWEQPLVQAYLDTQEDRERLLQQLAATLMDANGRC